MLGNRLIRRTPRNGISTVKMLVQFSFDLHTTIRFRDEFRISTSISMENNSSCLKPACCRFFVASRQFHVESRFQLSPSTQGHPPSEACMSIKGCKPLSSICVWFMHSANNCLGNRNDLRKINCINSLCFVSIGFVERHKIPPYIKSLSSIGESISWRSCFCTLSLTKLNEPCVYLSSVSIVSLINFPHAKS